MARMEAYARRVTRGNTSALVALLKERAQRKEEERLKGLLENG